MPANPHARAAKAYLEELCQQIDKQKRFVRPRKQWWRSPLIVPAVGLAAGLVGCSGSVESSNGSGGEICTDNIDNDGDNKVDCADPDCNCSMPAYSAPQPDAGDAAPQKDANPQSDATPQPEASPDTTPATEVDCHDGKDNDGDGLQDCADTDCTMQCSAAYMAPVEICNDGKDNDYDGFADCLDVDCASSCGPNTEICNDGKDNDNDGLKDCDDSDCLPFCGAEYAAPAYMAPVEICNDGLDNDNDGLKDCDDLEDCGSYCSADYAAPVEICNDKKDNDWDGKIDCKDSDCYQDPNCMQAAYAAPAE